MLFRSVADRKAHGLKSLVVVLQYKAYKSSDDENENESVQSLDSENSSVNFSGNYLSILRYYLVDS